MRRWIPVMLVVAFGLALAGHDLQAAKARNKTRRKAAPAPAREVTARLPRYFGQLELDQQQKAEVYAIQADYGEQIKKLREELADVQQQRDKDLQKVLTPAQRKAFSKLTGRTRAGKASGDTSSTSKSPTRKRKKSSRRST